MSDSISLKNLPVSACMHPAATDEIDTYAFANLQCSGEELLVSFKVYFAWPYMSKEQKDAYRPRVEWFMGKFGLMKRPDDIVDMQIGRMHLYSPNVKEKLKPDEKLRKTAILSKDRTVEKWLHERNDKWSEKVLAPQKRTSDTYLVYCRSNHNSNKYCLLGIIDPHAHYYCETSSFPFSYLPLAKQYNQTTFAR